MWILLEEKGCSWGCLCVLCEGLIGRSASAALESRITPQNSKFTKEWFDFLISIKMPLETLIYVALVLIGSPLNLMSFSIGFDSVGLGCKFKSACPSVKEVLYYISNNVYHWWYELSFWLQKEALQGVANSSSNKESDHKRPEGLNINYNCALIYNCCLTKCSLRNLFKISHPYSCS